MRFADLEPGELQRAVPEPELVASIVCWFGGKPVQMTADLWVRVCAARKRLGRPLQWDEVEALVSGSAEAGEDRYD